MALEPHHLYLTCNNSFLQTNSLINLSNHKQQFRHHPRSFLSDNNNSSCSTRLALPSSVNRRPYTKGQPFRPIFRSTTVFHPTKYFIRFVSPSHTRLTPPSHLQVAHRPLYFTSIFRYRTYIGTITENIDHNNLL